MAARRPGVHLVRGSGHFETDRAIAAGRRVVGRGSPGAWPKRNVMRLRASRSGLAILIVLRSPVRRGLGRVPHRAAGQCPSVAGRSADRRDEALDGVTSRLHPLPASRPKIPTTTPTSTSSIASQARGDARNAPGAQWLSNADHASPHLSGDDSFLLYETSSQRQGAAGRVLVLRDRAIRESRAPSSAPANR